MRVARYVFVLLIAAAALSATACTNPTAPAPAGDVVVGSGI